MSLYERLSDECKRLCYQTTGPEPSIIMPKLSGQSFLDDIIDFEVREDDVYIITYLKSGTTWMQQITSLLMEQYKKVSSSDDVHLMKKVPFLEMSASFKVDLNMSNRDKGVGLYEIAAKMPSPRLLKTHLAPQFLPSQLEDKKPKVIYVARHPKDVAVSFHHFTDMVKGLPSYESWNHFIGDFTNGLAPRGPWFENVVYWWNKRHEDNVFFVTYEEMHKDHRGVVAKVAKFLDMDVSDDVIDDVTKLTTFDAMKKDQRANPDFFLGKQGLVGEGKGSFMRKGKIGDWKNHFTVAQNEAFNDVHREKLEQSGLDQLYQL